MFKSSSEELKNMHHFLSRLKIHVYCLWNLSLLLLQLHKKMSIALQADYQKNSQLHWANSCSSGSNRMIANKNNNNYVNLSTILTIRELNVFFIFLSSSLHTFSWSCVVTIERWFLQREHIIAGVLSGNWISKTNDLCLQISLLFSTGSPHRCFYT